MNSNRPRKKNLLYFLRVLPIKRHKYILRESHESYPISSQRLW